MKDIYIADLANFDEGKLFDGFFLVLAKQQRTTKSNKPYLNLILGDKTGQLEGRIWELGDPRIAKDFEKGDIVKARGSASRFDDRLQMKIDQLRVAQHRLRCRRPLEPASLPCRQFHQPRPQAAAHHHSFRSCYCRCLPRSSRCPAAPPRLARRPAGARGQPAHARR
jgi:DNA polymerase III alpha subunit